MAQQQLNIGLVGGDGTGAPLRTSLGICQNNFTDLYTQLTALQTTTKLVATSNLSDLTDTTAARNNLGLGTAAVKNVTNGTATTVASVTGAFVAGHVLVAADINGTVADGGAAPGTGGSGGSVTNATPSGTLAHRTLTSTDLIIVYDTNNADYYSNPPDFVNYVRAQFSAAPVPGAPATVPNAPNYAATLVYDPTSYDTFYVGALTGNITVPNPSSQQIAALKDNQTFAFRFVQDGTGGRTITFGSMFKLAGSAVTAANAVTWARGSYVLATGTIELTLVGGFQ